MDWWNKMIDWVKMSSFTYNDKTCHSNDQWMLIYTYTYQCDEKEDNMIRSLYEVLQVMPDANPEVIAAAYRALSK